MLRTLLLVSALTAANALNVATAQIHPAPPPPAPAPPPQQSTPNELPPTTDLHAPATFGGSFNGAIARGTIMAACNAVTIATMSIQGKSLARGTSHDEMVESFGITWLLAGASLGHIIGAGAILGLTTTGFF